MIDPRTQFGHPMAHAKERPSVLDAEWETRMEHEAEAMFDEEVAINWWRVMVWTVAVGGCLAFWHQVLALFDWW